MPSWWKLAHMVRNGVRGIDSVGRYGGEEFLVVLPETEGKAATVIGDRLRQKVAETPFPYGSKSISVSMSGGVASYRDGETRASSSARPMRICIRQKMKGKTG